MKKLLIGLLLPALILYGCGSAGTAGDSSGTSPQNTTQVETKAPDKQEVPKDTSAAVPQETKPVETTAPGKQEAPKGIIYNNYKFENISLESAPQSIAGIYEQNKEQYKIAAADDGNYTYIIAMMGEKPTGGYLIKVLSIEDNEAGKLKVTVELKQPSKDDMVTQAITYPVDIVRIAKTNLPIYAVDTAGNQVSFEDKR